MTTRGFSIIELLVALVLTGIVGAAGLGAFLGFMRTYRMIDLRFVQHATIRDGASILPLELRGTVAGTSGTDLLALSASSVAYRATRGLYFVCDASDAAGGRLVLDGALRYGLRDLDPLRDSALVYRAESLGGWMAADVMSASTGGCPDGREGVSATFSTPLYGVTTGTPVRVFEVAELRRYTGGDGDRWVGIRTVRKTGGWNSTQPLLGPVDAEGLLVVAYDRAGGVIDEPARVARLGVVLAGAAPPGGPIMTIALQIGFRNGVPE